MISVHWLLPGKYSSISDVYTSLLASTRMRAGLVAKYVDTSAINLTFGDTVGPDATIIVVGKIGSDCGFGRSAEWLRQLREAKSRSCTIILDYTDHHLSIPSSPMNEFYKSILYLVDIVVVPSEHMRSLMASYFPGKRIVIEDALEVSVQTPRNHKITQVPILLWFGHSTNLAYLTKFLEDKARCDTTFDLRILSNRQSYEILKAQKPKTDFLRAVQFGQWTLDDMVSAARVCDACVIPSNPLDLKKAGVSSNRLLTSLALGLPTCASSMASYLQFSSYYYDIDELPLSGFFKLLDMYRMKAVEAQSIVLPSYEPQKIIDGWQTLLRR